MKKDVKGRKYDGRVVATAVLVVVVCARLIAEEFAANSCNKKKRVVVFIELEHCFRFILYIPLLLWKMSPLGGDDGQEEIT